MFKWFTSLFKKEEIEVTDKIDLSKVEIPLNKPNDVTFRFPDPTSFQPTKVKFHIKYKRKTTTKK